MPSSRKISRRGRPPSLAVAARKTEKIQEDVKTLLDDLEDLQKRLVRLESLLDASRRAERERVRKQATKSRGIRGKGPNVRDVAYQILSRRRKPMAIRDIAAQVLKVKRGKAGGNFTQNLGAALARDERFVRMGRGLYTVRR